MLTYTSGSEGNTNGLDASVMFQSPIDGVMLYVQDIVLEELKVDMEIQHQGGQDLQVCQVHLVDYPTCFGFVFSSDKPT